MSNMQIDAAAALALVADLYHQNADIKHQYAVLAEEHAALRDQYERLVATVRASAGVPDEDQVAPPPESPSS